MRRTTEVVQVWGLAASHGSTKDAARGAFTFREYDSEEEAKKAIEARDWETVITCGRRSATGGDAHR